MDNNVCIYTKKCDAEATFNSKEHIFPKAIGGIACLEKGWISDETNSQFSTLELQFIRENPLRAIPKMFNENLGRKKHKNREKISVFNDDKGRLALGFIKNSKPVVIDQILISHIDDLVLQKAKTISISLNPNERKTEETLINEFFQNLGQYNGYFRKLYNNSIEKGTYILGVKDNMWYLGVNDKENSEMLEENVKEMVKFALEKTNQLIQSKNNIYKYNSKVTGYCKYEFSINDIARVYAKIAFNCLAKLKGREYVLDDRFDVIRNAILTGNNIENYVFLENMENSLRDRSILGIYFIWLLF